MSYWGNGFVITSPLLLFNEMKLTDFCLNNTWFNKKLLILLYTEIKVSRVGNKDNTDDKMTERQCIKRIKRACKNLQLDTNKYLHLGRHIGSAILEMEEVGREDIYAISNWGGNIFQEHYLSIFTLPIMRSMAGFDNRYVLTDS